MCESHLTDFPQAEAEPELAEAYEHGLGFSFGRPRPQKAELYRRLSGRAEPAQHYSCQVLICSNTEEGLTPWMDFQPFLSVVIGSNTREGLTNWMCVQPFCQWFCSIQILERNSQTRCIQLFLSAQTLEKNSPNECIISHSCQWF